MLPSDELPVRVWIRIIALVVIIATLPIYMGVAHYPPAKMLVYSALAGPAYAIGEFFTDPAAGWAGTTGFLLDSAVMIASVFVFGGLLFVVALLLL